MLKHENLKWISDSMIRNFILGYQELELVILAKLKCEQVCISRVILTFPVLIFCVIQVRQY